MTLLLSGTDGLSDVDGSAATPAIRGTDANTGIFFPAADTIAFAEGGAEVMRLDSAGNLLVGSTSSYAGKNQSWGAVTANAAAPNFAAIDTTAVASGVGGELAFIGQFQSGEYAYFGSMRGIKENGTSGNTACALTFSTRPTATAPQERMRIDSSGNVGIGTTSTTTTAVQPCLFLGIGNVGASYASTMRQFGYSSTPQLRYTFNQTGSGSGWGIGSNGGADFIVGTVLDGASGSVAAERMRITDAGLLQFNSGYGSVATAYGCRAWVNFNGTGTVAIRSSGNVSSITDNTTGTYTVNFATAMPDANYSLIATSGGTSGSIAARIDNPSNITTTTAGPLLCLNTSFAAQDVLFVNVAIFR